MHIKLKFFLNKYIIQLVFIIILTSCVVNGRYLTTNGNKRVLTVTQENIIIFPPVLRYETIASDSYLSPMKYKGKEAAHFLMQNSIKILKGKGFNILKSKAISNKNILFKNAYMKIYDNRNNLFNSIIDDSLKYKIKEIEKYSNSSNIIAIILKVKVDSDAGEMWEHGYSFISSVKGYTRLKAILYNPKEGLKLWENEVQLREMPVAGSLNFLSAIKLLYKSLKNH